MTGQPPDGRVVAVTYADRPEPEHLWQCDRCGLVGLVNMTAEQAERFGVQHNRAWHTPRAKRMLTFYRWEPPR